MLRIGRSLIIIIMSVCGLKASFYFSILVSSASESLSHVLYLQVRDADVALYYTGLAG